MGKTTMARILAKSLNCLTAEGPTTEPCLKCDSCFSINAGDDIDVIEIDGASNTGVDNIRQLRQNAIYRPARARYKIYIIDEVHMLSTGAFNALLKILEEPPEHVKFIFATTEPNKVLPTIQSRCQRFDFASISPGDIAGQLASVLKTEKIAYEDDIVIHLARLANGSMRDALSLLDQIISAGTEPITVELLCRFIGAPDSEKICDLINKIADKDAAAVLADVDQLLRSGRSASQIIDTIIDYMRDMMVLRSTSENSELLILTGRQRERMALLADRFDVPALIYGITTLEKLRWTIKNSETPRALLEASMLRLTLSEHFLGIAQLLSQLASSPAARPGVVKKKTIAGNENTNKPAIPSAGREPSQASQPSRSTPSGPSVSRSATTGSSVPGSSVPASAPMGQLNTDSIGVGWLAILDALKQANPAGAGLFDTAQPGELANDILTVTFPKGAEFAVMMCEKRAERLAEAVSGVAGRPIRLKFRIIDVGLAAQASQTPQNRPPGAKASQAENERAIDDPAVRTLIAGLGATVTQIEQIKQGEQVGGDQ